MNCSPKLAWVLAAVLSAAQFARADELGAPVQPAATGEQSHEHSLGFENGELVSYMLPPIQRTEIFSTLEAGTQTTAVSEPALGGGDFTEIAMADQRTGSARIETTAPTDSASVLQDNPNIQSVNIQRRSTVAFDPRVRGYRLGQVFTDAEGMYMLPVRPDYDATLSRIDPRLINEIGVINGPYSARFGPGFAFIDVDLGDTPRFSDGPEAHNRLAYTLRANGPQHYVVDTFWGGNANYGYMVNYTYRQGGDYFAGNGQRIPSNYLLHNVSTQFGVDLSQDVKLELRYDFVDQDYTQIPGQFFDIDDLKTNSFLVSLRDASGSLCSSQMRLDAWHYRTPSRGTVRNEPVFNVQERVEDALERALPDTDTRFTGDTNSQLIASGGRWEFFYGERDDLSLRTGADIRHQRQFINENYLIDPLSIPPFDFTENTELPAADMTNPGLYAEMNLPMNCWWTSRVGGRVDYVYTTTMPFDDPATPNRETQLEPLDRKQADVLYSVFLMNTLQLTDTVGAKVGFGRAMRPPTLLERYSDGVFVSVLQSGFTRVLGTAALAPERLWQIDGGLSYDDGCTRSELSLYHSWVEDYITLLGATIVDPSGARLVKYLNTPLATLSGFEFKAETDLTSTWTTFITSHYVQGLDETLGQPLWGISPLEGSIGLRWHAADDPDWMGVELIARFVDTQTRLGRIRGPNPNSDTVAVESVTPSFSTVNIRGYWNPTDRNLRFVAGVENLFDENYLQHLDNRLPASFSTPGNPARFGPAFAFSPGITPYVGVDWSY